MWTEKIRRRNQFRTITVAAFPCAGVLSTEVLAPMTAKLDTLRRALPPGYALEIAGEKEEQNKSHAQMAVVAMILIVAIYGALVVQSWFETLTTDAARASKFYAALFGWTAEVQPTPDAPYTLFKLGSVPIGGARILPHMGNVSPHWGTYFAVKNADETARLGAELGAKLCMPVQNIPGVGRFALLQSPQGVPFHIIEYTH